MQRQQSGIGQPVVCEVTSDGRAKLAPDLPSEMLGERTLVVECSAAGRLEPDGPQRDAVQAHEAQARTTPVLCAGELGRKRLG
jgi:hypothetical protein